MSSTRTYPLTEAQLGIWIGHQSAPDPSIYNVATLFVAELQLDARRLQQALRKVYAESSALRLCFLSGAAPELSILSEPAEDAVSVTERSVACDATDPVELQRLSEQELERSFCIEQGELTRHVLYQLSDGTSAWLLAGHHIALDGYALSLLAQRVFAVYDALAQADVVLGSALSDWEPVLAEDKAYQSSQARRDAALYYRKLLRHHPTSVIKSAPARPQRAHAQLPVEVWSALTQSAKQNQCTSSDFLSASFALSLGRITEQRTFVIGVPLMLRLGSAAVRTPCMHMNIAPLVIQLDRQSTLRELAHACAAQMEQQRPHLRFRYEHLPVEATNRRAPFMGTLNLMPFIPPLRCLGQRVRALPISAGPGLDLAFALSASADGILCSLERHPDVLEKARTDEFMSQMLAHLTHPDFDAVVGRGAALNNRGKEQSAPDVLLWPLRTLAEKKYSDQPAMCSFDKSWSYRQLHQAVAGCRAWLRENGVCSGDLVAVSAPRAAHSIAVLLAILACDAGYVFVDPSYPEARQQVMVADAQPRVWLRERSLSAIVTQLTGQLNIEPAMFETWASERYFDESITAQFTRGPAHSDPAAYVMYTSGSTGAPKGVVIGQTSLSGFVSAAASSYGIKASDRVLQFAPLGFDASVEEIFVSLAVGATLVLRDDSFLESTESFLKAVAHQEITVLDLPTAYFHELCRGLKSIGLALASSVRTLIVGGEALRREELVEFLDRHPKVTVLNTYGPTEATVVALAQHLIAGELGVDNPPLGKPLPGVNALIIDVESGLLTEGDEGELALQGNLAHGYLGQAEASDERFVQLPGLGRAYLTGDRVRRDQQGTFHFLGRVDDEIKLSGVRISPQEVELALCKHPLTGHAVVWLEQSNEVSRLVASVECSVASQLSAVELEDLAQEMRHFIASELPPAYIPGRIVLTVHLPRNAHGKIDRKQVIAQSSALSNNDATLADSRLAGWTAPERAVAKCWALVLGQQPRAKSDDFFALGGSSLQVIQLVQRLLEAGVQLRARDVFEGRTLERISQALDKNGQVRVSQLFEPRPFDLGLDSKWRRAQAPQGPLFLTGATGYVGRAILQELLDHTDSRVLCLVRASSRQQAFLRLRDVIFDSADAMDGRLDVIVQGADQDSAFWQQQLTQHPQLGGIIHSAAEVSVTRSYESLYSSNVELTGQLLQIAHREACPLHFISSVATVPPATRTESQVTSMEHLSDGYQRTKWHAEQLVEEAAQCGVSASIYRLGRVVGRRHVPHTNTQDLVWRIVRAAIAAKAWPDLPITEPWCPVDETARAIVAISQRRLKEASPRGGAAVVFHLTLWGTIHLAMIQDSLKRATISLPSLRLEEWIARVKLNGDVQDLATLSFFDLHTADGAQSSQVQVTENAHWATENAERYLAPYSIPHPLTACDLDTYVRAALASDFISPLLK